MKSLPSTDRSLPFALMRARERVMEPIRKMLTESGITEQQWRVLRVLSEHGAMDPTRLAEKASLLLPSVTRIVQGMLDKGLLTRTQDQVDRRRQILEIKAKGQGIIDANLPRASEIAASFRAQLGDAEHDKLLELLAALDPEQGA